MNKFTFSRLLSCYILILNAKRTFCVVKNIIPTEMWKKTDTVAYFVVDVVRCCWNYWNSTKWIFPWTAWILCSLYQLYVVNWFHKIMLHTFHYKSVTSCTKDHFFIILILHVSLLPFEDHFVNYRVLCFKPYAAHYHVLYIN